MSSASGSCGARALGLSLGQIKDFLRVRDLGEPACHHVLASIEARIGEIDRQISELERLRTDLRKLHAEGLARPLDRADMDGCVCQLVGEKAASEKLT